MPKNKDNEKVNSRKGLLKRARGVWKGVKRIINRSQNRENERTPVMTSEKESLNSPYLSLEMPNPNLFEDVTDYENELNQVATKLENLEDNWNRESDTSVFYTNYVELNNSINELTEKVFPNISVEDFNEINDMAVELTDITKKVMDEFKQGRRRIIQLKAILTREAGEHFFLGDFEEKTREYDKEIKNLRTIRNNAQNIHREYSQYEDVDASSGISNQIIEPFIYIGEDTKNLLNNKLRTINEEYTNIVEKCNNDLHNIIYKGTSCRNMPKTQRDNIYNALKINKDGVEFKTKEQKVKFNDDVKIDYFERYKVDKEEVTKGGIEVELDETAQRLRYHNQQTSSELGNEQRRIIRQKWRNPEPVLDNREINRILFEPQLAENENKQEVDDDDIPLEILRKNKQVVNGENNQAVEDGNQQATDEEAPIEMSEQDFDDIKNMSYEVKAKAKDRIMAYKEARDIVKEFEKVLKDNKINYDAEEAKAVIESYIENIRNLRDIRDNAEAIYDECNEYITINTFSTMPGNDTNRETFEYINGDTMEKLKDDYDKLSEHKDISYIIEETANDLGNICFTDKPLSPQHVSIINTAMIQITERLDLLKRQRLVISDFREKSKEQIVDWNNEYVAKEKKVKFKQENDYKLYTEADNLPEEKENEDYTKEMEQEDNPKAVEQEEDSEEVEQDKETIIGTFYNTVGFSYIGDQLRRHGYESNRVAVTNPNARDNDRLNAAKRIQESIDIKSFNDLKEELFEIMEEAIADIGDSKIGVQPGIIFEKEKSILKTKNLSKSELDKLNNARDKIYYSDNPARTQEYIGINRFNDLTKEIYETRKASADIGDAIIHTQLGIREKQGILKVENLSESEMNKLNYARGEIYLKSGDMNREIQKNRTTGTHSTYRYGTIQ